MGLFDWLFGPDTPDDGTYTCASCDGKGRIYSEQGEEWSKPDMVGTHCGRCNGSGIVHVKDGKVVEDQRRSSTISRRRI